MISRRRVRVVLRGEGGWAEDRALQGDRGDRVKVGGTWLYGGGEDCFCSLTLTGSGISHG